MNAWKAALASIKRNPATFVDDNATKLALCIIEPRDHPNLGPVLWQAAAVYSYGVSLHVFHGSSNFAFAQDACRSFQNVHFHDLGVANLTTREYSNILTSHQFWLTFSSEFVLILQTDSLLLRPIEERFFEYDYVGAPWDGPVLKNVPSEFQVGNGGFSLRRTAFMLECTKHSLKAHPEDTFFSAIAYRKGKLPPQRIAMEFSVEQIYYPRPIGFHQAYEFITEEQMTTILKTRQEGSVTHQLSH